MARVTECEVKEIRPYNGDVSAMIAAAGLAVDSLALSSCGAALTDSALTMIELWLSAHFVGTISPTKTKEKFEGAENTYMLGNDKLSGILSDKYGQTANMLSGGCLVEMDKPRATVDFL